MGFVNNPEPSLSGLKIIEQSQGAVLHGLKCSDVGFVGFGEAYFSSVKKGRIKGWKRHHRMTLNLIVPAGKIRFIVHDANEDSKGGKITPLLDTTLGPDNYMRLTVPPGFWVAFQGAGAGPNTLLNIADIEHDPEEAVNRDIDFFSVTGFNDNE